MNLRNSRFNHTIYHIIGVKKCFYFLKTQHKGCSVYEFEESAQKMPLILLILFWFRKCHTRDESFSRLRTFLAVLLCSQGINFWEAAWNNFVGNQARQSMKIYSSLLLFVLGEVDQFWNMIFTILYASFIPWMTGFLNFLSTSILTMAVLFWYY